MSSARSKDHHSSVAGKTICLLFLRHYRKVISFWQCSRICLYQKWHNNLLSSLEKPRQCPQESKTPKVHSPECQKSHLSDLNCWGVIFTHIISPKRKIPSYLVSSYRLRVFRVSQWCTILHKRHLAGPLWWLSLGQWPTGQGANIYLHIHDVTLLFQSC